MKEGVQTILTFKQFLKESSHIENHPIEKMRDYNENEKPWEYREYTRYAKHLFPKAFNNENDFWDKYNKSPIRHLSHDEIRNLDYSTASRYLRNSPVDHKTGEAHAEFSHRRDLDRIHDQLHHSKMPPPIVLKHKNGMRILGGNTRLSYGLAQNKNVPVKVIDIG